MTPLKMVLLVEDDDIVNFYNEFLLKDSGLTEAISIARNGREALDYLIKCDQGEPGYVHPDLIFLDINMPIMNGFEFIEKYEESELSRRARALVVMLTTSLHQKDIDRAKEYKSISEYLYKPLMKESLKGVVEKYFG
ncbi:MAG: response regulator [Bacteroidia bacterium]|nr:response regulator [Bacteroidia bacterium]